MALPKIVTWYGHLRDTFAGKILTEIWSPENISEKWPNFYRQKCRAT
jgi:hypothetical protein